MAGEIAEKENAVGGHCDSGEVFANDDSQRLTFDSCFIGMGYTWVDSVDPCHTHMHPAHEPQVG